MSVVDRLTNRLGLTTFSLAAIPTAMLLSPVGVILPSFYAKYTAATLATLGVAMLIGRLFDAATDFIVGYLSDITPGRLGRRRPWMIVGAFVSVVSVYYLFRPPSDATATYYLIGMLGLYLGYTMLDIPHRAWASELSNDYEVRSRISMYIGFAATFGFVLFLGIPQLPFFESTDIEPSTLRVMSWIVIGAMPLVFITLIFSRERRIIEHSTPNILALGSSLWKNKPFWNYFATFLAAGIGNGVHLVLTYIFMDQYLGIGHAILASTLTYVACQLLGLPIWVYISNRIGKHKAWAIGQALYALLHVLVIFLPPGEGSFVPFLVLAGLSGLATSVLMFAPMAILGDVVDYDMYRTRENRSGAYFALQTLIMKLNFAIGGAIGFFLLTMIDFDARGGNSPETMTSFLVIFIAVPQVLSIISSIIIYNFPITRRKQTALAARLQVLKARGVVT